MAAARWKLVLGVVVVTAAAFLTACSANADEHDIVVYNGHDQRLTRQWVDAFTEATGIRVTLRNATDAEVADQILAEGDRTPADVLLTQNSPAMARVERADRFDELDPATVAQVPRQLRPESGRWTGIAARATTFVFDPATMPPGALPASLLELQQPQWRGRWTTDPRGADFQAIVAALLELDGENATRAWLHGVKDTVVTAPGNFAAMRSVGAGKDGGALLFATDYYRDRLAPQPVVGASIPHYFRNQDPGAYLALAGAGVLKSSRHLEDAQRFVRFVTGVAGQRVLSGGAAMEYPVAAGVPVDPALPPLDSLGAPSVDPSRLDPDRVDVLIREAGLL
ncbi:extracellular solute-binding protein [Nocardia veterana]|uniref:Extracellular solute-binding protein n=1 Tax=Nocardia veterana TaxID=132249 RepID=A0A7X6M2I6_9NOCA|nr:extracellular solute-binding protein [Nocardia veterana]NKY89148.1 extracellular solute-binding protein [Nocardia veterana]